MKFSIKSIHLFLFFMSFHFLSEAQALRLINGETLPTVFFIGHHESATDQLFTEHATSLIEVCGNRSDSTFLVWMHFLKEFEEYSKEQELDLNGLKIWISVFWEKDGRIRHLSYELFPTSKNLSRPEVTALFTTFARKHQLPVDYKGRFFHDGQASFPVNPILYGKK